MTHHTLNRTLVIAIATSSILAAASPSWSAPVFSNTTALNAAVPSEISDVRYYNRGYYRGNNAGAAVALGVLGIAGAVAASSAYQQNYYGYPAYGYGYESPGYAYGYQGYPGYYGRGPIDASHYGY